MSKKSGVIYDLGNTRYGLAIHAEQHETVKKLNKVIVHVFTDRFCTKPEMNENTGKKYVALKSISQLKVIGFSD